MGIIQIAIWGCLTQRMLGNLAERPRGGKSHSCAGHFGERKRKMANDSLQQSGLRREHTGFTTCDCPSLSAVTQASAAFLAVEKITARGLGSLSSTPSAHSLIGSNPKGLSIEWSPGQWDSQVQGVFVLQPIAVHLSVASSQYTGPIIGSLRICCQRSQ